MKKLIIFSVFNALLVIPAICLATPVKMTNSDEIGYSSFDKAGQWDNGEVPASGNDYSTGDFRLRTPPDGENHKFLGDSLTVNDSADDITTGLTFKGLPALGNNCIEITIEDLVLDGGQLMHLMGPDHIWQLNGNINVTSDSRIWALQGPIDIQANIEGHSDITIPRPNVDERWMRCVTLMAKNSFTGNIINQGYLRLAESGSLTFVIGTDGDNNSVSGDSALGTVFDGQFNFDLSGASTNIGDSWVVANTANKSFGPTFSVAGFTDQLNNTWRKGNYEFDEFTGTLSVFPVPEPPDLEGAQPGKWTMDLDSAKKVAAQKRLPILICVTETDAWGLWRVMEKTVFTKPKWRNFAADKLLMVLIELPKNEGHVPERYAEQNKALIAKYGVRGDFPNFVVLDDDGTTELGRLEAGLDKTPESFLAELQEILAFRPEEIAKFTATLSTEDQATYKARIDRLWSDKQELKKVEKVLTEAIPKYRELRESIEQQRDNLRLLRIELQSDQNARKVLEHLEARLATADRKLKTLMKTAFVSTETYAEQYPDLFEEVQDIEHDLSIYIQ